jgi:hypothetical protein
VATEATVQKDSSKLQEPKVIQTPRHVDKLPTPTNRKRNEMTKNLLLKVISKRETLTDYELAKVLEALWHCSYRAHPINRGEWKRLSSVVEAKLKG